MIVHKRLLETANPDLYLRSTRLEDASELYSLVTDPVNNAHLAAFERWAQGFTLQAAREQTAYAFGHMATGNTFMQYMARLRTPESSRGPLIGCHTLYGRVGRSAMLGCWQVPAACNNGFATLGAQRLIAYAQEVWGLEEVVLHITDGNARSQALARRLGALRTDEIKPVEERGYVDDMRVWRIQTQQVPSATDICS